MKKLLSDVKVIFTLLMIVSILAIVAGVYLGVAQMVPVMTAVLNAALGKGEQLLQIPACLF